MSNLGKELAGELTQTGHLLRQRVYYEDTDFSGIVYHARYLHFLERGRTDFLRLVGIHHSEIGDAAKGEALVWVVRRMTIEFIAPARIDDVLEIETRLADVSGARVVMKQVIRCDGKVLNEARVEAALINPKGRPKRFPKDWLCLFPAIAAAK